MDTEGKSGFQLSQLPAVTASPQHAKTTGARAIPDPGHITEDLGSTDIPNTLQSPGRNAYPSFPC